MSSSTPFCTVAKRETNNPDSFLPSNICFNDDDLFWIKPAYATWREMEETTEILEARIAGIYNNVSLPPNMERIANHPASPNHQKEYIDEFVSAAKTLRQWLHNHQGDDRIMDTFNIWTETCDKLIIDLRFTIGWHLPAFYPIYSHQCWSAIEPFFTINKAVYPERTRFWIKQQQVAEKMFSTWEPIYFGVCANRRTPFPKCLWYHKHHYVHVSKQARQWESYFQNTPFHVWGRIPPEDGKNQN